VALRRLFVAAALTDEVRHALASRLEGVAVPGRRVAAANWHLTLRFIGEVGEVEADRLTGSLDQADLGDRFWVRWGCLGAFPRPTKATVLWLGPQEGSEELIGLASRVEAAVLAAGAAADDRPFRPHLTLSRIRPPQDVVDLIEEVQPMGVRMSVERVLLMESHLGRGGARYLPVESFELD